MSIDQITKIPKLVETETNTMQKILDNIHQQAVGTVYATVAADAKEMADTGKIVVFDDGVNRRIYFKTSKGAIGYVTLTIV